MLELTKTGKENLSNRDLEFLRHIAEEIIDARKRYPDTTNLALALIEEVGEAAKAIQDHENDDAVANEVWLESVQAAAMCMRFGVEGIRGMRYFYGSKA